MATRTPLYLDFPEGRVREFEATDLASTSSLGTGTADSTKFLRGDGTWAVPTASTEIFVTEIDFGSTPVADGTFTVSHSGMTAQAVIIASVAYDAPTGKDLDELDMDDLIIRAGNASTNQFQLFIRAADGSYLSDKFKINYFFYTLIP